MRHSNSMEDDVRTAARAFADSISSSRKIVADISGLVEVTSSLPLSSFDYWERFIRSEVFVAQSEFGQSKWNFLPKPKPPLTWLDLISGDGYKRENTLRTLSGAAPNTFFFLLAIRRLNDWVPQVRKAAREKLPEIAKATNPEYVVDALCTALANWSSWGRIEQIDKDVLLQIICEEEVAASFVSKVISSPSGPLPSLYSQLGRTPILDAHIEKIALSAIQPAIRAKAYRSLFEGRMVWIEGRKWEWIDKRYGVRKLNPIIAERKLESKIPFLDLIEKSSNDDSSFVRRVSAEFLIKELQSLGATAATYAERFALDSSSAVSERGKFALKSIHNS